MMRITPLVLLLCSPAALAAPFLAFSATTDTTSRRTAPELVELVDNSAFEAPVPSPRIPLLQLAMAGAVATCIGDAAMHPMDCIKTLQQSDEGMALSVTAASRVLWEEFGIAGFYKGIGTYLITDASAGALKFGTYEGLKRLAARRKFKEHEEHLVLILSAAIAFLVSSVALVPGEFLKQQIQMGHYHGLGEALSAVFDQAGLPGFYEGGQGVIYRDVPYTMIELSLYDSIKNTATRSSSRKQLAEWQKVAAAAVTGGVAGWATTPLDCIKTKLMVDDYDGFAHCFMTTIQDHGMESVFAGSLARVAWLVPFSMIYLPLFDMLKRKLTNHQR